MYYSPMAANPSAEPEPKYVTVNVAPGAFQDGGPHKINVSIDKKRPRPNDTIIQYAYTGMTIDTVQIKEVSVIRVLWRYGLSKTLPYHIGLADPARGVLDCAMSLDNIPPCSNGMRPFTFTIDDIKCEFADGLTWRFRFWTQDTSIADRIMRGLLTEFRAQALLDFPPTPPKTHQIQIMVTHHYHGQYSWQYGKATSGRLLNSLYLDEALKTRLKTLVTKFFEPETQSRYTKYGRLWKKVCLLFGPPGTGKSSIVRALAGEFRLNLYNLIVNKEMTSLDFSTLLGGVPTKSIVLLEDVDGLFDGRESTHNINISSMLNVLDGVNTPEGILLILTTNRLHKLDPALVRPGRIDFRAEIGYPRPEHFAQYLAEVAPEYAREHSAVIEYILTKVPRCTIAGLQKYVFDSVELARSSLLDDLEEIEGATDDVK